MINNTVDDLIERLWFANYDMDQVIEVLERYIMNVPRSYIRKQFDRQGQFLFDEVLRLRGLQ